MSGSTANLAEAIVNIAAETDGEIGCSDCGKSVDFSDAETTGQVLATVQAHRERYHEEDNQRPENATIRHTKSSSPSGN